MARVSGPPRELPMRLSITRATGHAGDYIRITLTDAASQCLLARAEVSPEEFGLAVTGFGERPCLVEVFPDAPIGKRHEHKTVEIPWPYPTFVDKADLRRKAQEVVAPFEVDGWRCVRLDDAQNSHRTVFHEDQCCVRFSFDRWVDEEEEEEEADGDAQG